MRIFRLLVLLVGAVFPTTFFYSQIQYVWENRALGWGRAICMQLSLDYPLLIIALIIVCIAVWVENRWEKKGETEGDRTNQLLELIAKKLGVNTNDIEQTKSKRKRKSANIAKGR